MVGQLLRPQLHQIPVVLLEVPIFQLYTPNPLQEVLLISGGQYQGLQQDHGYFRQLQPLVPQVI